MIKVDHISIRNFRQYKHVDLDFSDSTGVYFFTGRNSMGKSNFMNAICWCLYGETPFKSENDRAAKAGMVNETAVAAGDDNIEVSITATIDGTQYKIIRKATSNRLLNPYIQNQGDSRVYRMVGGNAVLQEYPQIVIESLLPSSLSRLFIFDGEVIKKLFSANYNQELRDNIFKVANVDILRRGKADIQRTTKMLSKQLKAGKEDAASKSRLEESNNQDEIAADALALKSDTIVLEIDELDKRTDELNDDLLAVRETESRTKEMLRLTKDISDVKTDIETHTKKLSSFIVATYSFALVQRQAMHYKSVVDTAAQNKEIPPPISPSELQRILEENVCICDRHIDEEARKVIDTLLTESQRIDELSYLKDHSGRIGEKLHSLKRAPAELDAFEKAIDKLISRRDDLQTRLHLAEEDIRKTAAYQKVVGDPQNKFKELRDKRQQLSGELAIARREEDVIRNRITSNIQLIAEYIEGSQHNERIRKKIGRLEKAERAIESVEAKIIAQTREKVEAGIIETFKQLHWKPEFKRVMLDDEYFLSVLRNDGSVRSLGDLSVGEQKMLGLSIINALSRKLDNFDFPFFIDSPTEELDTEVVLKVLDNLNVLSNDKQVFVMTLNKPEVTTYLQKVPRGRKFLLWREQEAVEVTSIKEVE